MRRHSLLPAIVLLLTLGCPKSPAEVHDATLEPEDLPVLVLVRDASDPEGHVVMSASVAGGLASPFFGAAMPVRVSAADGNYPVEPRLPGVGICAVIGGRVTVTYFPTLAREPVDVVASCSSGGSEFVRFRIIGPKALQ